MSKLQAAPVGIDEVIITSKLKTRPKRPPDFEAEVRAQVALVTAMSQSPQCVFQKLVDSAKELCHAGSAGISIWEQDDHSDVFRWHATAGEYHPYVGETLPRRFSPCGTVLDQDTCILMADPVRYFPYIDRLCSPVREVLLIPFHEGSTPIGTVWVVAHDDDRHFDAEDVRIVTNLSNFAAAALSVLNRVQVAEKAEANIRQARTRVESTLIAGEVGTWVYEIERNQVFADRNLARMFGVSEEEAIGGPLEAYIRPIHPSDRPHVKGRINQALESDSTFDAEYRLVDATGRVTWVVARGTVERDAAGKAIRLPGVMVDITARKRAEEKLLASERRRHLALEAAELGTWNIDLSTHVMVSDGRFRRIFGVSADHLTYEEALGRIHPDDLQKVREQVAAATRPDDPEPYVAEYRVVHDDGSIRWVFARGRANFIDEGGKAKLHSFDGIVADMTERKNLEENLRRVAAELSEADRRKNEFLAMLAHELRNPLAPMRNALAMIKFSAQTEAFTRTATEIIDRQIDHMVHLVDDLLDVSRITRGKIELRLATIDVAAVIHQAVENSRPMIQSSHQRLTLELPEKPVYILADAVRIAQVLGNLLNNACKYSEAGGQIAIAAAQQGSELVVSIKDTGIGIAPLMLPKIFDLFTQIDQSLERSQGGLGIGLALVRKLVEMHAGTVTAHSEGLGYGSEFIVKLPVAGADANQGHLARVEETVT